MFDLSTLNPQQREAVETIHGPVLILAGAGTGKTRVITFRIAYMVRQGIAPEHILGVTFTNKAAREMRERVAQLIPRGAAKKEGEPKPGFTISTFHSLCVRILRKHIERLGYKTNFVIYDESDQLSVVKKILSQISDKGAKADPREVLALVSRFKNAGPGMRFDSPNVAALAEHMKSRYDSALRACNAVDFDDLILLTLRLLEEFPEVLEACRQQYQYVMVDEYQDTNSSQFRLVHLLTEKHRNFCVVGDDDQSIYGWRGAEIANLLDLEKYYPEVKIIKLEQNYRSTNTILNAANAVIKHNARRRVKQLWSQKGAGGKILLYAHANEELEAKAVVENIECDRMMRLVPWEHQAILFRTNMQSRPLETALRQASVRYRLVGGQSYFDRREIKDVLAYLKMLLNPRDDISLLRIANLPARGLSDLTMERLVTASQARNCPVYTVMQHTDVRDSFAPKTREAIGEFLQWIEQTREPLVQGALPSLKVWAERFLADIAYTGEVRRTEKTPEAAESRILNIKELLATMDGESSGPGAPVERLQTFLEKVSLDNDRPSERETEGSGVTLITMHSCKGLEFPHVQIVGLEDGLLPHTRSKEEGTLDEERRLFYVAITRAMKALSISHCLARRKYGQTTPCHPSPFLKELPEELVEWVDAKSTQPVAPASGKSLFDAMRALIDE
jgi:DNA helicase II / ATP-dependent DNA helicase PcrA